MSAKSGCPVIGHTDEVVCRIEQAVDLLEARTLPTIDVEASSQGHGLDQGPTNLRHGEDVIASVGRLLHHLDASALLFLSTVQLGSKHRMTAAIGLVNATNESICIGNTP